MPGVARRADGRRLRGRARERRLDRRQRRDRREVRRPGRALPDRQPGERRPQQGAQRRHGGRRGRVSGVPGQRRRAPSERLRATARGAREHRVGLRDRQRAPAHPLRHGAVAVPRARVHRDPDEDPRHEVPPADRGPDGVEQAVAAVVLGPPRLPLPGGAAVRGLAGHRAGALPGGLGRRDRRAGLPLADPRGRRPLDHAAAARSALAARPDDGDRGGQRTARRERAARGQALVRRERRGRRPALLRERAGGRGRRVHGALHGSRECVPGPGGRSHLQAAAGDRAAQVAPRPPPARARAAGGPAVSEAGPLAHASRARAR